MGAGKRRPSVPVTTQGGGGGHQPGIKRNQLNRRGSTGQLHNNIATAAVTNITILEQEATTGGGIFEAATKRRSSVSVAPMVGGDGACKVPVTTYKQSAK